MVYPLNVLVQNHPKCITDKNLFNSSIENISFSPAKKSTSHLLRFCRLVMKNEFHAKSLHITQSSGVICYQRPNLKNPLLTQITYVALKLKHCKI